MMLMLLLDVRNLIKNNINNNNDNDNDNNTKNETTVAIKIRLILIVVSPRYRLHKTLKKLCLYLEIAW